LANTVGSSREKPLVSREVSYNNQMRSFTVLSLLSASALSRRDTMIGWLG